LEETVHPEQVDFWVDLIAGGSIAGALAGVIPLVVGLAKRRPAVAVSAFASCVVGGVILGFLLAVPLALIFTVVLFVNGRTALAPDEKRGNDMASITVNLQESSAHGASAITHREKIAYFLEEVKKHGIDPRTAAPWIYKSLWALGVEIPPPHFLGYMANALLQSALVLLLAPLVFGMIALVLIVFFGGLSRTFLVCAVAGTLGSLWSSWRRAGTWKSEARTLNLPPWRDYPMVPSLKLVISAEADHRQRRSVRSRFRRHP
jgi:hypothetical protein